MQDAIRNVKFHLCQIQPEKRTAPDAMLNNVFREVTMLPKCGVCGKEVPELPKITEQGTCSTCGAKLKAA